MALVLQFYVSFNNQFYVFIFLLKETKENESDRKERIDFPTICSPGPLRISCNN